MAPVSRSYAFTVNNYVEDELDTLRESLSSEKVKYAIFGYEVGESGTPHLQGFVSFKTPQGFKAAKKVVGDRAHVEVAKASEQKNVQYCSKEGKTEEFGEKSTNGGSRTDLREFVDYVKDGNYDIKSLRASHPEICAKYPSFVRNTVQDHLPVPEIPNHALKPWQEELNATLNRPADDRTVYFMVDPVGNAGKSWFAKYYARNHENVCVMRPGKHADMAFSLPLQCRVLFLDATRQQLDWLPYTFIEECKDGWVHSTKYECTFKQYQPMHVVVLMNQMPEMDKLSDDRYSITKIS